MARRRVAGLPVLLALVCLVVTLGLVAAAVRPSWDIRYGVGYPRPGEATAVSTWAPTGVPSGPPSPTERVPSGSTGLGLWILVAIGALVLGVVATLLVRWLRGRRTTSTEPVAVIAVDTAGEPEIPVLQRGAEAAARRLLGEADPTDAIITAWLALEEAAAASGVPHEPAETPTEFTAAVLTRTGVDPEPVRTLLGLYHRARFSAAGSRPEDLLVARRCVRDLAEAWRQFALDSAVRD